MTQWTFYSGTEWWNPMTWDWSWPKFHDNGEGCVTFEFLCFAIRREELS